MRVAVTLEQCWHRVPGGTAVAALEVARELTTAADVEQVGVSAFHRSPPPPEFAPPIAVRALPLPRRVLYETWHAIRQPHVELATKTVDVIHVTGVAMPPATRPLVVTVHDLAWRHDSAHFTKHGLRFFRRAFELTKRDAALVLCSSEATRRDCVDAGLDESRLRVVPLGVRITTPDDPARARAEARTGGRPYVLWNGTFEPRKNVRSLLRAFAAVRGHDDVHLVLVGPEGWKEDLRPLGDRVIRLPFQPAEDLAALHADAIAFCYPSIREGFGLPVLEAMAQGTPVITSRGTATEEVAGDQALLVDPNDVDDLAWALQRLLDDASLRAELGAAGRARASEFTWERTAELTRAAYRDALTVLG